MQLHKTMDENVLMSTQSGPLPLSEVASESTAQVTGDVNAASTGTPNQVAQKRIRWVGARRSSVVAPSSPRATHCPLQDSAMDWECAFAHLPAGEGFPKGQAILLGALLLKVLNQLPRAERAAVVREIAEAALEPALAGLEREERIQLMNALLPLALRIFPLADLDLSVAFPISAPSEQAGDV